MKKQKFLTLFSILALCVCSLFIGVWAAKTATVTTGGSISFTATGVNCKVSGAIQNSTASLKTLETLTFSASDESSTKSWGTSNAIAFDNNETPINIVITVENLVDRALYAQVTNAVFGDGSQFDVTLSTELLTLNTAGTGTIIITITPKPMDVSVTKDYSFNVVLTSKNPSIPLESDFPNLTFRKETSVPQVNGFTQATVTYVNCSNDYKEIYFPDYIKIGETVCIVTEIPRATSDTSNQLYNADLVTMVRLPIGLTGIASNQFTYLTSLQKLYIDSEYISAFNTDTSQPYLTSVISTAKIYVKADLVVGSYITKYYDLSGTETKYDTVYNVYTRNSTPHDETPTEKV